MGEMIAKHGSWFSHDQTPRALLFREGQSSVTDEDSMMTLLRSNNYLQSSHSTPLGCSGPIPSAAIASRSDLQWSNVTCTWQFIDYMTRICELEKYYHFYYNFNYNYNSCFYRTL